MGWAAFAKLPCYASAVKRPPFLAREAFLWLTLFAPPAITLLISGFGSGPAPLEQIAACLLSVWVCTIVCALTVHTVVNFVAPRLLARTSPVLAGLGIAAIGAATVVVTMSLLLPRLVWLDPNLARSPVPFILQALVVATVYVIGARLTTWLGERARAETERARDSEERALRARLAALQAQVNPHFLFNTLNAIASLIPTSPESAESTIERLAGVLQYSIASSSRGRVTLAEELSAVRDYLEIEQARFGERLRSTIDVDEILAEDTIPPMLLQPLVENAVLHGLSSKDEGGAITVHGRADEGTMVLMVSDDGVGPGGSKRRGNDTGLKNLRERLALTYGQAAQLSVRARPGGGFECEIRMPRASPN
jgi:two-component system sensor histidine kinase AlgZ